MPIGKVHQTCMEIIFAFFFVFWLEMEVGSCRQLHLESKCFPSVFKGTYNVEYDFHHGVHKSCGHVLPDQSWHGGIPSSLLLKSHFHHTVLITDRLSHAAYPHFSEMRPDCMLPSPGAAFSVQCGLLRHVKTSCLLGWLVWLPSNARSMTELPKDAQY